MGISVDWLKRIAKAQADKCGLVGLSRLLVEKVGQTVFVTNESGRVLSWQVPMNNPVPQEEKIHLPSTVRESDDFSKGILTLKGKRFTFACWAISNREVLGYLWILVSDKGIAAESVDYVECIRAAMLVEISKKQEKIQLDQRLKDEFIRNLLFNNLDSADQGMKIWGLNLALDYVVILLEGSAKGQNSRIEEIRTKIEDFFLTYSPEVVNGVIGNSLIAIFTVKKEMGGKGAASGLKGTLTEVYKRLQEEFPNYVLRAGVGNVYSAASLYRSFQEAKVAIKLGRCLEDEAMLAFFNELGAIRLFYNQHEHDLRDYFLEVLGPVQKYDTKSEGNLLGTLWTYYISGGNIAATTSKLHIHVNTLRYRLRKVEELLEVSLEDHEVQFNVYAALKVGKMMDMFKIDGLSQLSD